jgi:tetratricopeptide (TPR) repeat protein
MSDKCEGDKKQFSQNLSELLSEISELIRRIVSEFGPTSSQIAERYLELGGFLCIQNQNPETKTNEIASLRDTICFKDTLLAQYVLHDPSQSGERLQEAESALINSLDLWIGDNSEKVKKALLILLELGTCWEITGDSRRANALTERVAGLSQKYLGPANAVTVSALNDMAVHCFKLGKLDAADSYLEKAYESCQKNPEAMEYYGPRVLINLSSTAGSRGQFPIAACFLDQALEEVERLPEPDKFKILEILCNQAKIYSVMNQRERFDQPASRALKAAKEHWRSDPDFASECMMTLFGLYQSQGRFDEARAVSKTLVELAGQ